MSLIKAAGYTVEIVAGAPASLDIAGFSAQSHVEIGEVTSVSAFGAVVNIGEVKALSRQVLDRFEGSIDPGKVDLSASRDPADPGQIIVAAGIGQGTHSLKLTDSSGFIVYATCLVASYTTEPSDSDSVIKTSISLPLRMIPIAGQ